MDKSRWNGACELIMNTSKTSEYHKQYYQEHKTEFNEYRKQFRLKNPEYGKEASRKHRERYPDRKRKEWLQARYGLSSEAHQAIFESQAGKCAICGRHQSQLTRPLCVDHNHQTGKVRGLLCIDCNCRLATLEDKEFCSKVSFYLQGSTSEKN